MTPMMAWIKTIFFSTALVVATATAAQAATFTMKRGINLDQWVTWPDESRWNEPTVILPFPEWRKTVGEEELRALEEAGFDFVRMPVDPAVFLSDKTTDLRGALLDEVVRSANLVLDAGLKVVVDLHAIPGTSNRAVGTNHMLGEPERFEAYLEFVREIAGKLTDADPERVALELMNEPTLSCEGGEASNWPEKLARLHAAARSTATRLTLVLSGACWGTAEGLALLDPASIPDDNVIWSFHSYAPFLLTHQGATWTGDFIAHVTGLPYPPHAVPRAELDAALETIRQRIRDEAPWARQNGMLSYLDEQIASMDTQEELAALMAEPFGIVEAWTKKHGIPPKNILLGEFGMIRQEYGSPAIMPGRFRAAYAHDMIALAEAKGFAWSLWSYGGAFGTVEEFDGREAEANVLEAVRSLPSN